MPTTPPMTTRTLIVPNTYIKLECFFSGLISVAPVRLEPRLLALEPLLQQVRRRWLATQQRVHNRHHEQGHERGHPQAADDRPSERRVLLTGFAERQRH